jgi:nucleoside-diphosphate-sugar epimerase
MNDRVELESALITGPTGAVGVALIEELLAQGIAVTAICRPGSNRLTSLPAHPKVKIVECDLLNLTSLASVLKSGFDAFYHFGWDGTYGTTRQDMYLQTDNIRAAVDAVHLAHALGCKVFVGAGSQSEYGHIAGVMHPDTPCNPDNGYGIAKLAAGMMSRELCSRFGIRHEWCRILSLYGPYDGEHTLVMSTIKKLLNDEHLQFTKGEQVWDYIYSKDAARAFRLVAERGTHGSIYCFGSGKPRELKEYISALCYIGDSKREVVFGELEYYPNQVMHLEADIANLTGDTGFLPSYSFEEGIRETIAWAKDNNG